MIAVTIAIIIAIVHLVIAVVIVTAILVISGASVIVIVIVIVVVIIVIMLQRLHACSMAGLQCCLLIAGTEVNAQRLCVARPLQQTDMYTRQMHEEGAVPTCLGRHVRGGCQVSA